MLSSRLHRLARTAALLIAVATSSMSLAQDTTWRVSKVSGEAWIGGSGVQPVSMSENPVLRPGETVRTGRNGRVLLVRGAESILVSANSSISLPEADRAGQTTIIQQAGSILLDVEKRNVPHFEVETPYLAAVVKGTQFRVSLQGGRAKVDVVRGQVQVSDFRSGQFALVSPGQSARASFGSNVGLNLSGTGILSPVQSGPVQSPRVAPLAVPSRGLGALPGAVKLPRSGDALRSATQGTSTGKVSVTQRDIAPGVVGRPKGAIRISAPIGDVKLDISKVTRGIARSETATPGQSGRQPTVWSTGELNPGTSSNKNPVVNNGSPSAIAEASSGASANVNADGAGRSNGAFAANPVTRGTLTAQGNGNNGNGNGNNGNGNGGNGNGNGNGGNNGNGNGNGNGGNNGNGNNGNGNGGNGNGNGNGGNNGNGNGNGNGGNNGNGNNGNGNGNANGNGNGNGGNNGNGNGNGKK
jgi:hypothetical protein